MADSEVRGQKGVDHAVVDEIASSNDKRHQHCTEELMIGRSSKSAVSVTQGAMTDELQAVVWIASPAGALV